MGGLPHRLTFVAAAVGMAACSLFVDTGGLASDGTSGDASSYGGKLEAGCDGSSGTSACTCNRDCHGEPCVAGECAVTVLASKQLAPSAIALDDSRVYWASYDKSLGSVKACSKTGCNDAPAVIADNQAGPNALIVAGGRAFWSNLDGAQIQCRPVAADAGPPTTVSGGRSFAVAFEGDVLHFTDDSYGGSIRSFTQWRGDGCTEGSSAAGTGAQPAPRALVTGNAAGYWISESTIRSSAFDHYPDTPASTVVANQPTAHALAVDMFDVFWTNESGTVMSAPLHPKLGAATTLAQGLSRPWAIAVLGSDVYFTTIGTGGAMIAQVPKSGGPVIIIASKRKRPVAIAVDERYVYWTDAELGTVERATR